MLRVCQRLTSLAAVLTFYNNAAIVLDWKGKELVARQCFLRDLWSELQAFLTRSSAPHHRHLHFARSHASRYNGSIATVLQQQPAASGGNSQMGAPGRLSLRIVEPTHLAGTTHQLREVSLLHPSSPQQVKRYVLREKTFFLACDDRFPPMRSPI